MESTADIEFEIPPAATRFRTPFSQRFIDTTRNGADSLPWPRNVLEAIMAEILQIDRDAHEAIVRRDLAALDQAIMRRSSWEATLHEAKMIITKEFLAMASIAVEKNPDAVLRILSVNKLQADRLDDYACTIADLQIRLEHAEAAIGEIARAMS
ncbi:MAG: hypothetical protein U0798_17570 [Gemmataceae bacterium]